jgi:hypothetical protein
MALAGTAACRNSEAIAVVQLASYTVVRARPHSSGYVSIVAWCQAASASMHTALSGSGAQTHPSLQVSW